MEQVLEKTEATEGKVLDSNSSTEEILKNSPDGKAEAETSQVKNEATDTTGEVENTQLSAEEKEAQEEKALLDSKKPVPYERFSQVIKQRNELKEGKTKNDEVMNAFNDFLSDPKVLKDFLKKQGHSEKEIADYFKQEGISEQQETKEVLPEKEQLKSLVKDLDLSTQEGWLEALVRVADFRADKKAKENLQQYDQNRMTKEQHQEIIDEQEKTARKLCEDVYKIPFGESGKDEENINTAVGLIWDYANRNPDKIRNPWLLGHSALLKLAMNEKGFKFAEQKGERAEKDRQKKLKNAALEGDETTKEVMPDSNSSIDDILAWRRKHPED